MKGDFSRITFDAANHFSRVLLQQGRVTVDADPNEQAAILLHYVRTLARDLIGPCGGPVDQLGFGLSVVSTPATPTSPAKPDMLMIGAGRYYVDGILCENEEPCLYAVQPDYAPVAGDELLDQLKKAEAPAFWIYLDVWERHITCIEDDRIREVALGGPDTCTRTKVVWQVKALARDPIDGDVTAEQQCTAPLADLPGMSGARLAAELDSTGQSTDPCVIAPDARYRGAENQLYRVEIQRGGTAGGSGGATFKWSRDNGSVASAWLGTEDNDVIVANARGFSAGNWVELSDDARELRGEPGILVRLTSVADNRLGVDPSTLPTPVALAWTVALQHPKVRRWDQIQNDGTPFSHGAIMIVEGTADNPEWVDLEDGVRVQFAASNDVHVPVHYNTGDYWLIPARVATGDVEWPRTTNTAGDSSAAFLPPRGIEHHYAPLGWIRWDGEIFKVNPCVCALEPLSPCTRPVPEKKVGPIRPAPRPPVEPEPVRRPAAPKNKVPKPK